jgi:hypothetical protein
VSEPEGAVPPGLRSEERATREGGATKAPGGERGTPVRWSVGIEAEGDRVLTREEVVELADAVAVSDGIATGIGTNRYGAQLVVQAASRDEAIEQATEELVQAAARAGLPAAPIVRVEAVSEDEDQGR